MMAALARSWTQWAAVAAAAPAAAPSSPGSIGLGVHLPAVLLEEVTRRAFETHASAALYAGFGILGLGFLWRVSQQILRDVRGQRPDYVTPLLTLLGFASLISAYQPLVKGCVHVVSQLGAQLLDGEALDASFGHRVAGFAANWKAHATHNVLGLGGPSGLITGLLQTLVILGYALVSWSAGLLRLGQTFMLAVIITYGPLSLGCASLGGPFAVLGLAWFWALVEVCAWSLTLDVLNYVFAPLGRDLPSEYYWVAELMLCLSLFVLIASVPLITSMLVRSQAAAMMPRSNILSLGTAVSAASSVQRSAKLAAATVSAGRRAAMGLGASPRVMGGAPGPWSGSGAAPGVPPRSEPKSPWMQKFAERMQHITRRPKP